MMVKSLMATPSSAALVYLCSANCQCKDTQMVMQKVPLLPKHLIIWKLGVWAAKPPAILFYLPLSGPWLILTDAHQKYQAVSKVLLSSKFYKTTKQPIFWTSAHFDSLTQLPGVEKLPPCMKLIWCWCWCRCQHILYVVHFSSLILLRKLSL